LEGSLEPELMFAIARRSKCDIPFSSAAEVKAVYHFNNAQNIPASAIRARKCCWTNKIFTT